MQLNSKKRTYPLVTWITITVVSTAIGIALTRTFFKTASSEKSVEITKKTEDKPDDGTNSAKQQAIKSMTLDAIKSANESARKNCIAELDEKLAQALLVSQSSLDIAKVNQTRVVGVNRCESNIYYSQDIILTRMRRTAYKKAVDAGIPANKALDDALGLPRILGDSRDSEITSAFEKNYELYE